MTSTRSPPPREPRPLRVTYLPTEVLREIFDYFKDARMGRPGRVDWFWNNPYDDLPTKRRAILNCRLACRRLHELATPMLLPTVRVKLEQGSLDRLDEISRIPDVASSVRGLEIILAYRSKELAADLGRFTARRRRDLWNVRDHESGRLEIAQAWDEYLKDPSVDTSRNEHQTLLRESYHEYRRQLDEQNRLVDSGAFADAIASAVSRMPLFGSLLFDDVDIYAGHLTHDELETIPLPLVMTAADGWTSLEAMSNGLPPARLLSDVPVAIHRAGVPLREVGINCFPKTAQAGFHIVRDPEALRAACQGLEEVIFWLLDGGPGPGYSASGLQQLNEYLGALLSGPSLDFLLINAKGEARRNFIGKSHVGSALRTLNGARLKKVFVEFSQFTHSEWDEFCGALGNQLEALSISDVGITDGTWRPSIDILRRKTASRCEEGVCEVSLYQLAGGEFGDGKGVNVLNWWDHKKNRAFVLQKE